MGLRYYSTESGFLGNAHLRIILCGNWGSLFYLAAAMHEYVVWCYPEKQALKVKVVCGLNDLHVQVKFHGGAVPENKIGLLRSTGLTRTNGQKTCVISNSFLKLVRI